MNKDKRNLKLIKGLGDKTINLLKNLNINYVEDLLTHYPYRYTFLNMDDINNVEDGRVVIVGGTVESIPFLKRINIKMNLLTFKMSSNRKIFNVTIYNRAYMKKNFSIGKFITVFGKWNEKRNTIVATNIIFDKIEEGTIESVYHLTNGINNKAMTKYIKSAINSGITLPDYVPDYLNEKYKFIEKKEAIHKIHMPSSSDDIKKAKLKLIYEELFEFMFKMNYIKILNKEVDGKQIRNIPLEEVDEFLRTLPFELTRDQLESVKTIHKDMTSNKRMNRMLQGDVGSGKTIVGVIASYINYLSKGQTALMAPTEILASQHFENIKNLLIDTNMKIALMIGNMKKKEKSELATKLEKGQIDLIIGTHALLNDEINFKNLSLVITDEQHRFGVNQRAILKSKGSKPDILYMSATPIPRTYALTLYGDMEITNIKTKPKGRKEIKTIIKSEKEIKEVLTLILEEIKKGRQVYVVSPLIEESEGMDSVKNVTELKRQFDVAFNNKIKTEVLHGKLSKTDKDEIMQKFLNNEIKVLISTTVIEVGLDVKNATMMVIFNADRFGLATLHQLRGRIGRNTYDGVCVLIGPKNNKRLKVLEESNDGFYITEKDFEMRKEGDLFGVKQSGEVSFKIADLQRDFKILLKAKEDSNEFLEENIKNNFKNYETYYKIVNEINELG